MRQPNILNDILLEMKMIQLQLYLAKRSAKGLLRNGTPDEALLRIDHSLQSLDHLIVMILDQQLKYP